jgi:cytochrome c oxidase subunit III
MSPQSTSPPPRPSREPSLPLSAPRLGLYVLFASLTVLFAASLVGYLVTRSASEAWRPAGMPGLPAGLWVSSVLVIGLSVVLEGALAAARRNQPRALNRRLWAAVALALVFLMAQGENWLQMHRSIAAIEVRTLFPYTFYMLTGLHAAHVVGGLIPLGIVIARAQRREYSSSRHEGVLLCVQYWHFLTGVWAVLFVTLELGSA